jgi:hypothetical protein
LEKNANVLPREILERTVMTRSLRKWAPFFIAADLLFAMNPFTLDWNSSSVDSQSFADIHRQWCADDFQNCKRVIC